MMLELTKVRALVADTLPHSNEEFIRQVRDGEQDDGPFMRGALAVMKAVNGGEL